MEKVKRIPRNIYFKEEDFLIIMQLVKDKDVSFQQLVRSWILKCLKKEVRMKNEI